PGDGAKAGGRAPPQRDPLVRRSSRSGRRRGWSPVGPPAGRAAARARRAAAAVASLGAGRAPHAGAVPHPGSALRLSLMVRTEQGSPYHAVGGANMRLQLTIVF